MVNAMTSRLQIVVSSRLPAGPPGIGPRQSLWRRFKTLLAGIAISVVAVALLVVALVLGSILAAVVLIVLVVAVVAVIVKVTLRRTTQ